jgi:predicted glutamine amidotransferase
MCGIVGIAGNLAYGDEAIFRKLLVYDYFRGPDSTGIAVVDGLQEKVEILKTPSHPFDLMDMRKFNSMVNPFASSAFIGHNRAATLGKVNTANAHPFREEHIVGVHNGTLSLSSFKELKTKLGEEFEVDSQAIFAAIAKFGVEETIPMLQGAWALVWFDLKTKTLNFIRNKERPLWYAYSDKLDKIYWASEYLMIGLACKGERHNQDLWVQPGKGEYKYFAFDVDTLFSYNLTDFEDKNLKSPVEPIKMPLKGKEPEPVTAVTTYSGYSYRKFNSGVGKNTSTSSGSPFFEDTTKGGWKTGTGSKTPPTSTNSPVVLFGHSDDPYGGIVSRNKFNIIAEEGCSFCGKKISYGDVGLTIFLETDQILCSECSSKPEEGNRIYVDDVDETMKQVA